jgi:hypothetical protein
MIYNICAYLYLNIYGTCIWYICKKVYLKFVKKIEFNLGFEPIKNAPNLHMEWKGDWWYQWYELHIVHISFNVTFQYFQTCAFNLKRYIHKPYDVLSIDFVIFYFDVYVSISIEFMFKVQTHVQQFENICKP